MKRQSYLAWMKPSTLNYRNGGHFMQQLEWELKRLCRRHREGSFAAQGDRQRHVEVMVRDLDQNGFSRFVREKGSARRMGEKHVIRLVNVWKRRGLSVRTIDNRLATFRRIVDWQGKGGVVKRSNAAYRGESPPRVRTEARRAPAGYGVMRERIQGLKNAYARASLLLQLEFHVRREESLKVIPARSTDDVLVLHGAACKGGKARALRAETAAQREAIRIAKEVAGRGSLIPPRLRYETWRDGAFRRACRSIGLEGTRDDPIGTHVLRHEGARAEFRQLSGMASPLDGGPYRKDMGLDEKARDWAARDEISSRKGHGRRAIASAYVGGARAPDEEGDDS